MYPGSAIHVTPSFYFSHVVYVDISRAAIEFFSHKEDVAALIEANKTYSRSSYFDFLAKDFHRDLGLRKDSFDLLISIFSGKQIEYCEPYVKEGGLVLTSSFFSDNESMERHSRFEAVCVIRWGGGRYHIEKEIVPKRRVGRSGLKNQCGI